LTIRRFEQSSSCRAEWLVFGGFALASSAAPFELDGGGYPGGKIFNRAAFLSAPAGQQASLGRNVPRGFAATQSDISVQRQFHFAK